MIGIVAAGLAFLSLVDSRLRLFVWVALALAILSLFREPHRRLVSVLALVFCLQAEIGFSTGADSLNYFAYTSSLLSDGDLDFSNQWARLSFIAPRLTPTGLVPNEMSVGPGLIWMPAVAATHLWLLVTGGATDPLRLGPPYYAAAAATTLALLLFGVFALGRALAHAWGKGSATLAVLGVTLASPILYYATLQPLMSHALTFGAAALVVALTLRAERENTTWRWAASGAALGLAALFRAQAIILVLFVLAGLFRARASFRHAAIAAASAAILFVPQFLAWKVLYGAFLTVPQGDGFIDWRGRHAFDVLFSADRGLFNWHPVLVLGLLGLCFALKRFGSYVVASFLILAFTTFLNGSVRDWNASAAFGGRRFDLVLPLLGLGLGALVNRMVLLLWARPLIVPATALALATLWNVSLIDLRQGTSGRALPLDDLARLQANQARRVADATIGRAGVYPRSLVYRAFVGLFTYENYRQGGDFDLATLEPRFLKQGWSEPQIWDDGVAFRYLLHPQGCITIPLDEPFDLRGFVLARAPARIQDQRVSLILNDQVLAHLSLPAVWTELPFEAPARLWRAGENTFCVRSDKKRPGDEGDDLAYTAAVVRIQLP
ncbi:MAG: hypothetical protein ABI672_00990 [Vicinamibacteria bacterium]